MDTSFGELGLPPDLEEDSTTSNERIAAIEESQRSFEERIGSQMQRMEQLLMTLITDKDQKPAVTFQPTIPTAETPQKFKRRDSVDTRTSLNSSKNIQSASKQPQTASGSQGNPPSNTDTASDRVEQYSSMTIQHPETFKVATPIQKITIQSVRNLENEIMVYQQKPQNRGQTIYLFNDNFLTLAARNYLVSQIHERNTNHLIPAATEWRTYDHERMITYMKSILRPRTSKEAEKHIVTLITQTLDEPGNKITTYAWHAIASWSNKIFRAFEAVEYYFKEIYPEDAEFSASMRPNKQLDLEGLGALIPAVLFPKDIAIQINAMYVKEKFLAPYDKGFTTLTKYLGATREVLRNATQRFTEDQYLIRAIYTHENKAKATSQINALCSHNTSFLNSLQAVNASTALLNLESFGEDDRTDLLSELSRATTEREDADAQRLTAIADSDIDIDNLVCYRAINGARCVEKNCKFSHDLEDIALYHRVKGRETEAKIREAKVRASSRPKVANLNQPPPDTTSPEPVSNPPVLRWADQADEPEEP